MTGRAALSLALLLLIGCAGCGGPALTNPPTVPLRSKAGVAMVLVPGGSFMMGSDAGEPDEKPRHDVTLSPFVIDVYEVTQDQYAALELPDPSHFKGARRPVEQVRWSDAALFCNERSGAEGLDPCYDEITFVCNFEAGGYRLPTEAEWEYAARAGGDATIGRDLKTHAWYSANAREKTQPVDERRPNPWGIHGMYGNVSEWCHDVYQADYYGVSPDKDPRGPGDGPDRVMRGGNWTSSEDGCALATRYAEAPGISDACFARDTFGFRCVRRPTPEELARLDE
jgi:formylglycine-generating enzyme required for sulfatase activity